LAQLFGLPLLELVLRDIALIQQPLVSLDGIVSQHQ
jgi:hypothetical protein